MSNEFWLREIIVSTAGLELKYPDVEIRFTIDFDDGPDPDMGTVELYNLARETENQIQKDGYFVLSAGYQNDVGTLLAGMVGEVRTFVESVDRITTVEIIDATEAYLTRELNKSYVYNSRLSFIIEDILKLTGLEIGRVDLVEDIIYPQGRVVSGRVKEILRQLVEDDGRSRLYIRNGTVFVVPPGHADDVGVLLNAETGLIRSPTRIDSDEAEWELTCLLNYRIRAGTYVQIESHTARGLYRVVRGSHTSIQTRHVTRLEVVGA